MKVLKQIWVAFNRWRKRHWLLRVIILWLFAAHTLVDQWYIPWLVRIACESILADAEPRTLNAIYHSNRANATRRLQAALVAKLDTDGDGVLGDAEQESARDIDLDPIQLALAPLHVDLEALVLASQRARLVPLSYTPRAIKKDAWRAALVEAEEIMAPEREKIESFIAWYRVPEYAEWRTWKHGFSLLLSQTYYPWCALGDPFHLVPGLLAIFLAPAVAVQFVRRKYVVLGALAFWLVLVVVTIHRHLYWVFSSAYSACLLGQLLLVGALLLAGVRRAMRQGKDPASVCFLLFVFGAILICWGLGPAVRNAVHKPEIETSALLLIYFSSVTRVVLVVLGGVAICLSVALVISKPLARVLGAERRARH